MKDINDYPKRTSSKLVNLINFLLYEKKRKERNEPIIINGNIMPQLKAGRAYEKTGHVITL